MTQLTTCYTKPRIRIVWLLDVEFRTSRGGVRAWRAAAIIKRGVCVYMDKYGANSAITTFKL